MDQETAGAPPREYHENGLPVSFDPTTRGGPTPFGPTVRKEFFHLRSDLKEAVEPDKAIFEYANCILRASAWWVATAASITSALMLPQALRPFIYVGLVPIVAFGLLLLHQIMMINRDFANRVSFRYHRRGTWGLIVAQLASFLMLLPFVGFVVLIGSAVAVIIKK